jgi:hypothetical protein
MDCRRVIHLMSNTPFPDPSPISKYEMGEGGTVAITQEAGVYHFRVDAPYQGPLAITVEGWKQAKRMVAWSFEGCMNVTEALMRASVCYEHTFGCKPQYGFLKSLPRGVENGRETGPLLVFEAEWMLERAVAVW